MLLDRFSEDETSMLSEFRGMSLSTGDGAISGPDIFSLFTSSELPAYGDSTATQLKDLRCKLGFNITELASLLNVKRPTIYEWLESNGRPNRKNEERLDSLYAFFKPLILKKAVELRSYLYKTAEAESKSLFDLLSEVPFNAQKIKPRLDEILKTIETIRDKRRRQDERLAREGFEPVSEAQKNKRLEGLIRKIGW